MRAELQEFPGVGGTIREGLTVDEARKLRQALVETPGNDYFACVRSGRHLPADCEGPAAVFGGFQLSAEEIAKARGYS